MELSRSAMKKLALLIALGALLFTAPQWLGKAGTVLHYMGDVLSPFILGAAIAFILHVPMNFIERKLLRGLKKDPATPKQKGLSAGVLRALSLTLTLLFVILILLVVVLVVFPQLAVTIAGLGTTIQSAITRFLLWTEQLFSDNPQIVEYLEELSINWQSIDWKSVVNSVIDFLKNGAGSILSSTITATKGIVSTLANFAIALVFSIYILLQKEKLGDQFRKAALALLPQRASTDLLHVCSLSHRIFTSFITGQCIEAVILGTMFFLVMTVMRMPYALLVGCLISVTALIPIVGAFIGCFVGAFLLLMESPMMALVFVITFLVLQQVEGNLIYPHVVGSSVGLPSIWVLVAVTVGGSLMGVVGMLIFIPLLSVCYTLFREFVYRRLNERNIQVPPSRP